MRGRQASGLCPDEADALATLLTRTIDSDRYPFSPRIRTLKAILAKLAPQPVQEPVLLPPGYVHSLN
jgi:hypothetical protein